jgi:hypothetical protein
MKYWLHNINSILIRQNNEGSFEFIHLCGDNIHWRVYRSSRTKPITDIKDINTSRVPFKELSKFEVDKMLMMKELAR